MKVFRVDGKQKIGRATGGADVATCTAYIKRGTLGGAPWERGNHVVGRPRLSFLPFVSSCLVDGALRGTIGRRGMVQWTGRVRRGLKGEARVRGWAWGCHEVGMVSRLCWGGVVWLRGIQGGRC